MDARVARRRTCRAPAFLFLDPGRPAAAHRRRRCAADGVPLYPPGIDAAYAWTSMENPDMSGPVLDLRALRPWTRRALRQVAGRGVGSSFWNAATGVEPADRAARSPACRTAPTSAARRSASTRGDVYVVWPQWDDPVTATRTSGCGAAPRTASPTPGSRCCSSRDRPAPTRCTPDDRRQQDAGRRSPRRSPGPTTATPPAPPPRSTCSTSAPTPTATPLPTSSRPGFDPAYGRRCASTPAATRSRVSHDPAVGPMGVFWLDAARRRGPRRVADVWRGADLNDVAPVVSLLHRTRRTTARGFLRATGDGAAWLGPGVAGGPFEPWGRNVGEGSGITHLPRRPR